MSTEKTFAYQIQPWTYKKFGCFFFLLSKNIHLHLSFVQHKHIYRHKTNQNYSDFQTALWCNININSGGHNPLVQTLQTQLRRLLHRRKRWVNEASEVNKTHLLLFLYIHLNTTSAQDSKQIIVESYNFCPDINTQIQNLFMYVSPPLKEKLTAFEAKHNSQMTIKRATSCL